MLLWKLKRLIRKRKPHFPVSGRTKIIGFDRDSVDLSLLLITPANQVVNYRSDDGESGGAFRPDEHRRILFRQNVRKVNEAVRSMGVPLGTFWIAGGEEMIKEPEYVDMIWRYDNIISIDWIDVNV